MVMGRLRGECDLDWVSTIWDELVVALQWIGKWLCGL